MTSSLRHIHVAIIENYTKTSGNLKCYLQQKFKYCKDTRNVRDFVIRSTSTIYLERFTYGAVHV